ncbi:hypothetical protein F5Y15DRAFT_416554 [Xylariaceae sp. FL0016]|nr:hypothetical protein F5Y15DRAFT_416554 [Xylariaceae sp. FL0016]
MAPATVSVVYPKGAKFDMEYYLATHMPLVQKTWAPSGLKSWKVAQYSNPESPHCVQAWLEWESVDHWTKAASSSEGATVFADIENFSDKKPEVMIGEIKESKTC